MNGFQFFLSTKVDFGRGKINSVGSYCESFKCKKVTIVSDGNLIKLGLHKPIEEQLNQLGIEYNVYDGVVPNPTDVIIDEGTDFIRKSNSDLIIALGGGSSMDTAKGMAILAVNNGKCYEYLDGRGSEKKAITNTPLPIIAIPTTSGTGSEVTMYSVITDKDKIKDSITSADIYPKVAIIDPELTFKLPKYTTACTGLDVLSHALEAYTSNLQNPMTNIWALEAIKIVFDYLPKVINTGDEEGREKMAMASVIAGSAMSHCGATIPHALGCPISGHLGLPHGLTVGVLQIPMIRFNLEVLKQEFYQVVKYVKPDMDITVEDAGLKLIEMIEELFVSINVDTLLKEENVDEELWQSLIHDASIHGCLGLNRREVSLEAIKEIYEDILN